MNNTETIKKFYNAFQNNDEEKIIQFCDERTEWITLEGMPHGGKYVGVKSIFQNYFPNMLKNFKEFHVDPKKYFESGDHVIVIGEYEGISKKDKKFNAPFSHIYQIENNKIIKFEQFTDTKKIQDTL